MISKNIENLIVKYMSKSANINELDTLEKWIENPENSKYFFEYVQIHYAVNFSLIDEGSLDFENQLIAAINKEKRLILRRKRWSYLKYAAFIIVLLGTTFYFSNLNPVLNDGLDQLVIEDEKIILEMDDGAIQVIEEKVSDDEIITDKEGNLLGVQQGSTLKYKDDQPAEKLVYNKISVPYGKTFQLELSDNTKVYLNAGSSLKYPVKFLKGYHREVFVEGEAYFEVTEDKNHPFIANAGHISIEVTGTAFNISNYEEDNQLFAVITEGSVNMKNNDDNHEKPFVISLSKGELGDYNKESKEINVKTVDTSPYTAWIDGVLVFKHLKFKEMVSKLERHFNLEIINNNLILQESTLTARFENASAAHVLRSLQEIYKINYEITDNKIIIN